MTNVFMYQVREPFRTWLEENSIHCGPSLLLGLEKSLCRSEIGSVVENHQLLGPEG